ncbi:MAG: GAF domain-containing protein, partial [Acidobacteriota bacterium]|nr:GAF domain-containing protein [Acidobacteriota bacterium]
MLSLIISVFAVRRVIIAENLLREKNNNLQKAFDEIKVLRGILPICMHCKGIRNDEGYWNQ